MLSIMKGCEAEKFWIFSADFGVFAPAVISGQPYDAGDWLPFTATAIK
jgi:hypothetical protein